MIYHQLTHLPIIFQIDEGASNHIEEYLLDNKLNFQNIVLVSGPSFSKVIASKILETVDWSHEIVASNLESEVETLRAKVNTAKYDLLVAVGGGKVLDMVKRVSFLNKINHIAVPTTISNDGLISPIAVLEKETGGTVSIPGQMPMGVVMDLDIIIHSPIKYLKAAAGDILSNISSTNDWKLAFKKEQATINDLAFQLSKSSAHSMIHFKNIDIHSKPFVKQLVQSQINSGIAMSLAGTSRPCSGSEHLISHAIDFLGLSHQSLHGLQVGSISLFCLYLQGKLTEEIVLYAKQIDLPLAFHQLSPAIVGQLRKIHETALLMRPGRYTILDQISAIDFETMYREYCGGVLV